MQPGDPFRRLVYDIGMVVGGVSLRMELADPGYVEGRFLGDTWLVMPTERGIAKERLAAAFSQITRGLIGNKVMPRQDYRVKVALNWSTATILVSPDSGPNVRQGLAASPGWDGHSFYFKGSHRVAALIADIKEGVLFGAYLVRSNGAPIVGFERFVEDPSVTGLLP